MFSIEKIKGCNHTIIDPSQSTVWKKTGISNLQKAGFDFFELIEKPSEIALPELLSSGKNMILGFLDGWHNIRGFINEKIRNILLYNIITDF